MLGKDFVRKLKLLNGREELVTTRWETTQDMLVEHITLEVPGRDIRTESTSNRLRKIKVRNEL